MSHKGNDAFEEYQHDRMIEEGGPISPDRGRYIGLIVDNFPEEFDTYYSNPLSGNYNMHKRRVYSDELKRFNESYTSNQLT